MTLVIKKRGRPSKQDVQARTKPIVKRDDAQILSDLKERYPDQYDKTTPVLSARPT